LPECNRTFQTLFCKTKLSIPLVLTALNFKKDVSNYVPVISGLIPSFMMTELLEENKVVGGFQQTLAKWMPFSFAVVYSCLPWVGAGEPPGGGGKLRKQYI